MKTLVLDTTTKSITIQLSASAATTNPDYTSHWGDDTGTSFIEGSFDGVLNGVVPVTVVSSPSTSSYRIIKEITVNNVDTAPVTLFVKYIDGANSRSLYRITLAINETWTLDDTIQADGSIKAGITGPSGSAGPQGTGFDMVLAEVFL